MSDWGEKKIVTQRTAIKPINHIVYELGWIKILEVAYNCSEVQLVGRSGQKQFGLDVTGYVNGDPNQEIGIQCKFKGEGKQLTVQELEEEVGKLVQRPASLPKKYFVMYSLS